MLTVIQSQDKPLNKVIGGADYQNATFFKYKEVTLESLEDLSKLLTRLEDKPMRAVIRHKLKEGVEQPARRKGNIDMVPSRWLCLDYDNPAPEDCPDYTVMPEAALEYMMANHWQFLEGVGIHWTLGNSAGVKPQSEKLSFHLWVELEEPVLNPSQWLRSKGFDFSLAHTGQIHYTASPDNAPKLAARSGFIKGVKLTGVTETAVMEKGDGVSLGHSCPDYLRAELVEEAETVEVSERHPWAAGWSLRALAAGMDTDEVTQVAMDAVIRLGYSEDRAQREISSLVESGAAKLQSGAISVDTTMSAELAFAEDDEEEEVADPQAQAVELCGPSLLEGVGDAESPIEYLKNHKEKLKNLDEFQVMELEEILMDKGILVESKPKAGQITRGRLGKLVKAAGGGGAGSESGIVSPEVVKKYKGIWENTYCTEKNGAYSYFFYDEDEKSLRLASKRDEIDSMCSYITANEKKAGALLFREEFYRDIHEKRCIDEFISNSKPFGDTQTVLEVKGTGKLNAVTEVSIVKHLEMVKRRYESVVVPPEYERFLDKEYSVVWDVVKASLARRFLGDKRSTVWIHCPSNWGKSFFFGGTPFGMTLTNKYSSEDFKGNDPADIAKFLFIFVDEADRFTKEMKLDTLSYRRLWGGHTDVVLPIRILASANPIGDLSDGVDKQLKNRVTKIKADTGELADSFKSLGWSTEMARKWYEAILSRRLHSWLTEWGDAGNFTDEAAKVFGAFTSKYGFVDSMDVEEALREDFWQHFIWDHVYKVGGEYRLKTRERGYATGWAAEAHLYVDNGSDADKDRRRLYIKRVHSWLKTYIFRTFEDKGHAIFKAVPNVEMVAKVLGGKECQTLPNANKFKGVYFDLNKVEGLEEVFNDAQEG